MASPYESVAPIDVHLLPQENPRLPDPVLDPICIEIEWMDGFQVPFYARLNWFLKVDAEGDHHASSTFSSSFLFEAFRSYHQANRLLALVQPWINGFDAYCDCPVELQSQRMVESLTLSTNLVMMREVSRRLMDRMRM